jgi:hypothetical protein
MAKLIMKLSCSAVLASIISVHPTTASSLLPIVSEEERIEVAEYRPTQRQILRKKMIKGGRGLLAAEYRYLADDGDGLAAYRFAKIIKDHPKVSVRNDAIHYFSLAVSDGKSFAVKEMIALLKDDEVANFRENRIVHFERVLLRSAKRGNPLAINGLISLYRSGEPFGRNEEVINDLLSVQAARGSHDAALKLAIQNLSDADINETVILETSEYLKFAAESDKQSVSSVAVALLSKLETKDYPELFSTETKEQ